MSDTKVLKEYIKLLVNDIFDLKNPTHKKIMLEVLDRGQSPFDLSDEEIRELYADD